MRFQEVATGDLRDVVTVYSQMSAKNAFGEARMSWTTARCTVRACIVAAVNRPTEALNISMRQVVSRNPTDVIIRWRKDVSVTDQVEWDGRRLNIESVYDPEAGRRRWLVIRCVEVQS